MAGCGRRFAVRASIACFAAAIGLGTTAAASEAAAKPIQITVQVGYHNTVKLGQWMPVVVDLTNTGPAVDGTLEVQASNTMPGNGGPPIGAAVYHMPLSLATGATKHVRTYVTEDFPGSIDVRVGSASSARACSRLSSIWLPPRSPTRRRCSVPLT